MLKRSSNVVEAYAECHDCDWTAASKNAAGIAAQHARRNQHEVTVTVTMATNYMRRSGEED